jgi:Family of unknown function (DUF6152)
MTLTKLTLGFATLALGIAGAASYKLTATGTILTGAPALARDPGPGEYDQSRLVRMYGEVVKVDFADPYSYVYLDVTGDDGARAIWTLRMSGADILAKGGWSQNSVSSGTRVEVLVNRAKDGTHRALMNSIKLEDGGAVFTGPAGTEDVKH